MSKFTKEELRDIVGALYYKSMAPTGGKNVEQYVKHLEELAKRIESENPGLW